MTKHINEYISALKKSGTLDDAFAILEEFGAARKLPYFLFTAIGTHNSPVAFKVNYMKTNYPEEWMDVYIDNVYFYADPIAQAIFSNQMPFFWSEHLQTIAESLTEDNLAMMRHAMEYGLKDGIGASYLKNKGHLCTLAMASTEMFETYDYQILSDVYLIGSAVTHLHEKLTHNDDDYESLSQREREIVNFAALGKTDGEIAQIAGITTHTVRYHWKNIFEKLNSYSRVFAIVKAMNLGYVDPYSIEVTTESGSIETYRKSV